MNKSKVWARVKAFPLFSVIMFTTLLGTATISCALLFLAWMLVWPVSRHYYRRLLSYLTYPVWCQFVFIMDWWSESNFTMYMDSEAEGMIGKEQAVTIMNHNYDLDIFAGTLLGDRFGLSGASKVFAKRSLSHVPVIGWMWTLSENIFLDRNWQKDKSTIVKQVTELTKYQDPLLLLIAPEGTRFTAAKHDASVEYAKQHGLKPLEHLLIPRSKGFHLTMQTLKETNSNFTALYDTTFGIKTGPGLRDPTLTNIVKGRPMDMHLHVTRIPIEKIPVEEKACERWLQELFQRKDGLMAEFKETGSFPGRKIYAPRSAYTLITQLCWITVFWGPVFYYATCLASPSGLGLLIAAVTLLTLCTSAFYKLSSKDSKFAKPPCSVSSKSKSS